MLEPKKIKKYLIRIIVRTRRDYYQAHIEIWGGGRGNVGAELGPELKSSAM